MSLVDWTPVDILADIIPELAGITRAPRNFKNNSINSGPSPIRSTSTIPVYHTVNPRTLMFSELVPIITSHLGPSIKVVPYADWVAKLKASGGAITPEAMKRNPGLKIVDFYEGLQKAKEMGKEWPIVETRISEEKSATMRELEAVRGEWMEGWLRQWGF